MPWGFAIAAVGTYLGGQAQKKGAQKAGDAQERAAQMSVEEQRRQYDLSRQDMAPWLEAGGDALGKQQAFLNGDWSGFMNAPDYKYALDQGVHTLDRSAASHGGLFGGAHSQDLTKFGQGLALQNANGYYDKLAGLSNTGHATATNLGQLGSQMASNIGNAYTNAGNARASSYINQANATSNMYNSFGQIAGNYFGTRNGQGNGWGGI